MFKKELKVPIKIRKLEALLSRLPLNHPNRHEIEEEIAKCRAGFRGEKSIDYYLSFLANDEYYIFHDLRLPFKDYYFQQDILLLTPTYFLILEVKNISGTLTFDRSFNQIIRTTNGIDSAMPDPVLQVHHQRYQLLQWLKQFKFPNVPIETIVVVTNSNTILKDLSTDGYYTQQIIRSSKLLSKIISLTNRYTEILLSPNELRKMSKLLIKHHTPLNPDLFQRFNITPSEILTGVICPQCKDLPMKRKWGQWFCENCTCNSKIAHIEALNDYALLFQPTITNKQMRHFLHVANIRTANYLLTSLNLPHCGECKGRVYSLKELVSE